MDLPFKISPASACLKECDAAFAQACYILLQGGLLVYPTETWLALGCLATNDQAINIIYQLKNRPESKPLPLICANMDQLAAFCQLDALPMPLAQRFWPGPLTVILPPMGKLPARLLNAEGKVAIRISENPLARALSQAVMTPLVASSANLSGQRPSRQAQFLQPDFLEALHGQPLPAALYTPAIQNSDKVYSQASTIVEPLRGLHGDWFLKIRRPGAISRELLENQGFKCL